MSWYDWPTTSRYSTTLCSYIWMRLEKHDQHTCGTVDILVSVLLAHEVFVICDLSDHTQALDEN